MSARKPDGSGLIDSHPSPDTVDALAGKVANDPSIIDKVRDKLAKGIGDIELAAFLGKLFGADFDLKAAAAFPVACRGVSERISKSD
jgi:hypothetical protein